MLQTSIDELGEPLRGVTFVVVDLETTGGSHSAAAITEIGAVKIRGGEVLGEFSTLVNPGIPIPPYISLLTGITNAMVDAAPGIDAALPAFLEWARDSVVVAHNAPFDIGFLKAACAQTGRAWPSHRVIDTVILARNTLNRDEVPNCKLSTLAAFFQADTDPVHRALADARATVDVLHGLLGRLNHVDTLVELTNFLRVTDPERRKKRHLASGLPQVPGVYIFRDAASLPLYIGHSANLSSRVANYFTSSENRTKMTSMIRHVEQVEVLECAHSLEAAVRELRLIVAHKPPYNRKSKYPKKLPAPARNLDASVQRALTRVERLSDELRYEDAAAQCARLARLLRGAIKLDRLSALAQIPQLIAARPDAKDGWEISVIRHGRLAAAGTSPSGAHPGTTLELLLATAESVPIPAIPSISGSITIEDEPTDAASIAWTGIEECEILHAWLLRPDTRLVRVSEGWSQPVDSPGRWSNLLAKVDLARTGLYKVEIHPRKWSTSAHFDR
ncbi:MAG: DEDD exonuclease domain-containing protein [Longispora sp.]|nr:DEDD exonuclease domain-containing protein [Longispora sp. (in: high G+C Gram-positive bacteria)]